MTLAIRRRQLVLPRRIQQSLVDRVRTVLQELAAKTGLVDSIVQAASSTCSTVLDQQPSDDNKPPKRRPIGNAKERLKSAKAVSNIVMSSDSSGSRDSAFYAPTRLAGGAERTVFSMSRAK